MTTPLPTRTGPTPCQGSTVECVFAAFAMAALVPLVLWALADPVLAAVLVASITVAAVAVAGLLPRD